MSIPRALALVLAVATAAEATPAFAQAADPPAAPGAAPICTDRPGKATAPCTAEAGTFQVETDVVDATLLHVDGTTTDTLSVLDPTLKYGLSKTLDVEVDLAPYEVVRTRSAPAPGASVGGVGDLYLRAKYAAFATADGAFAVSVAPYVKAPTARLGIGDGAWEGGGVLAVSYRLSDQLSLALSPELDVLGNDAGAGRHLNHIEVVALGWSLPHAVVLTGELWGEWDYDPSGEVDQYSGDIAAAWGLSRSLQLDAGLDFGLNRNTPGVQGYVGISKKF